MRKLVLWPSSKLKMVSASVEVGVTNAEPESLKKLNVLAADMLNVAAGHGGVGLAAIQVGVPVRVIVALAGGYPRVFVNPKIIWTEGEPEPMLEGCLSVPGFFDRVMRYPSVVVEFNPLTDGAVEPAATSTFHGLLAQVLQHESDHLDGKLFVDELPAGKRQNIRGSLKMLRQQGQLAGY